LDKKKKISAIKDYLTKMRNQEVEIKKKAIDESNNKKMTLLTFSTLVSLGFAVGLFTGTFGLGGGLLLVPALVCFLGLSQTTAQGTSITIMLLPIGLFAFLNYYKAGHVKVQYAIIIAIAIMIGSFFGSKISLNMADSLLKRIFGCVLLFIALKFIISK
jgi:uncharacterized protein